MEYFGFAKNIGELIRFSFGYASVVSISENILERKVDDAINYELMKMLDAPVEWSINESDNTISYSLSDTSTDTDWSYSKYKGRTAEDACKSFPYSGGWSHHSVVMNSDTSASCMALSPQGQVVKDFTVTFSGVLPVVYNISISNLVDLIIKSAASGVAVSLSAVDKSSIPLIDYIAVAGGGVDAVDFAVKAILSDEVVLSWRVSSDRFIECIVDDRDLLRRPTESDQYSWSWSGGGGDFAEAHGACLNVFGQSSQYSYKETIVSDDGTSASCMIVQNSTGSVLENNKVSRRSNSIYDPNAPALDIESRSISVPMLSIVAEIISNAAQGHAPSQLAINNSKSEDVSL